MHSALLGFHGFLAGFQFLSIGGLDVGDNDNGNIGTFLLTIGFLLSGVGSLFSIITAIEFYNGVKFETNEMIVLGVLNYWKLFYLSDIIAVLSTGVFLLAIQFLVHFYLRHGFAVAINVICGVLLVPVLAMHYLVIIRGQRYQVLKRDSKHSV